MAQPMMTETTEEPQEEQEEMLDHEMFLGAGVHCSAIQNMKLNVFQNPRGFQATCEIASLGKTSNL